MGITFIIMGGIVLITAISVLGSILTTKKKEAAPEIESRVGKLEQSIALLENRIQEKDERISQLEGEIAFVNKLIEDKSK